MSVSNLIIVCNNPSCYPFSGSWFSPIFAGCRPPPCADFTLTSIDPARAILYGGDRGINDNNKDLYLINFTTKVMKSTIKVALYLCM